jgi:Protein of unknown function (DUF3309)
LIKHGPDPGAQIHQRIEMQQGRGSVSRCRDSLEKEQTMLGTILIVFLILALFGVLPRWSHSRNWGYMPTGSVSVVLVIVVILVLLGRI